MQFTRLVKIGMSMSEGPVTDNSETSLRAYEVTLIRLHRLIASGEGDEPEADELRDALDEHAQILSASQVRELDALSGDLYMISGNEVKEPFTGAYETPSAVLKNIKLAHAEKRWDDLLYWLRKPTDLSLTNLATLRYLAYRRIGKTEAATEFLNKALEISPDSWLLHWSLITLLLQKGDFDLALEEVEESIRRFGRKAEFLLERAEILASMAETTESGSDLLERALESLYASRTAKSLEPRMQSEYHARSLLMEAKILYDLGEKAKAQLALASLTMPSTLPLYREIGERLLRLLTLERNATMPQVRYLLPDISSESEQGLAIAA